jgi:hypothetical protein
MIRSFIDILIRPDTFFERVFKEKESLKLPALIVLFGAVFAAGYASMIGGLTGSMMAAALPGMEAFIAISTIIFTIVAMFIAWVIITGVFFGMSFLFKGQGSFSRCLEGVGYGYLPQVFGSLISLVVAFDYIPRIVVPQISSSALQDPQVMTEAVKTLMQDPAMRELTQISTLISIVFLLWSANIWIYAMKNGRALSMRDSAICVGLPILVYVIYLIYTMTGV